MKKDIIKKNFEILLTGIFILIVAFSCLACNGNSQTTSENESGSNGATKTYVLGEATYTYAYSGDYQGGLVYKPNAEGYYITEIVTTAEKIKLPSVYNDGTHGELAVLGVGIDKWSELGQGSVPIYDSVLDLRSSEKLKEVIIPSNILFLHDYAFSSTHIERFVFEKNSNLKAVGEQALASNDLVDVTLPESLVYLSSGAFHSCQKIESITLDSLSLDNSTLLSSGYVALHPSIDTSGISTLYATLKTIYARTTVASSTLESSLSVNFEKAQVVEKNGKTYDKWIDKD